MTPHNPDVTAFFLPQTGGEGFDWFAHELHARRRWRHTACKDIVLNSRIESRAAYAFS
jgi:hypothetical protein